MRIAVQGHSVTMVHAAPKWVNRLQAAFRRSNNSNIAQRPLYVSLNLTAGSWERVENKVLPELNQPEYVLGILQAASQLVCLLPAPTPSVGMATEAGDIASCNAGITLQCCVNHIMTSSSSASTTQTACTIQVRCLFCAFLWTCIHCWFAS